MKNSILLIFPDGVGIKNYLYSSLLSELKNKANLHFWSTLSSNAFIDVEKLHNIAIENKKITLDNEPLFTRFFREAATYARLLNNSKIVKNDTILFNWKKNNKSFNLKVLYFFAEILGAWAHKKYARIIKLEKLSAHFWDKSKINSYKQQLQKINPNTIFITHQRVAALMPICIAAKELGIKIVTIIYSWDNLPKGRLAVKADNYLVWSQYMKNEMLQYYPEIDQKNVIVTGTTQFEFYFQKERLISRNDFARKHNLDASKKWICFSGDDNLTSPYDENYLQDFAEAVSKIPENSRPQIIFRRCPVDFSTRYDKVLRQFPDLIFEINPIWNTDTDWGLNFSKIEDLDLMSNLGTHCDLVANIGSTMAHDFAIFDKPCFYINYNIFKNKFWNVESIYNLQHFRSMDGLEAVGWFNSKDEIATKIQETLKNSYAHASQRKLWTQKIIYHPLDKNYVLIANELLSVK